MNTNGREGCKMRFSDKIEEVLDSMHVEITGSDLYDLIRDKPSFFSEKGEPYSKATVQKYIKMMEHRGRVGVRVLDGRKTKLYISGKKGTGTVRMDVIGNPVDVDVNAGMIALPWKVPKHGVDDPYLEGVDRVLRSERVSISFGVTVMNVYDVTEICGTYKWDDGNSFFLFRRRRDEIALYERALESGMPCLPPITLLFDAGDARVTVNKPHVNRWEMIAHHELHQFENEKPGMVLNGHNLVWATENHAFKMRFVNGKEPKRISVPVHVIIVEGASNGYIKAFTRMMLNALQAPFSSGKAVAEMDRFYETGEPATYLKS